MYQPYPIISQNIVVIWLVVKKNILKNDGVRQWEGWHLIYEMENNIHVWNHQPAKDLMGF
jgi:hypothetical protein